MKCVPNILPPIKSIVAPTRFQNPNPDPRALTNTAGGTRD